MKGIKSIGILALGCAMGLTAHVAAAKGHDQGVADGTRTDPSSLRGGVVAGVNVPGIGSPAFGLCAPEDGFCGVVGDAGQTYGQDIVAQQRERGIRRVTPVETPGLNKPPRG